MEPIHFIAAKKPSAQRIAAELINRYGQAPFGNASYVVAVGGDGTTLNALQMALPYPQVPVFSMRTPGSVGALGNPLAFGDLVGRLTSSRRIIIRPLQFEVETCDGKHSTGLAINEVVLIRSRFQATRWRMWTGKARTDLFGDGMVIASAIGSTGYCQALGGPRLHYDAEMLALTGIAIRRPAEGLHLAVPGRDIIRLEVSDPVFRPAHLETSTIHVQNVFRLVVRGCVEPTLTLLMERDEDRLVVDT